jgi:hypothetical protein
MLLNGQGGYRGPALPPASIPAPEMHGPVPTAESRYSDVMGMGALASVPQYQSVYTTTSSSLSSEVGGLAPLSRQSSAPYGGRHGISPPTLHSQLSGGFGMSVGGSGHQGVWSSELRAEYREWLQVRRRAPTPELAVATWPPFAAPTWA